MSKYAREFISSVLIGCVLTDVKKINSSSSKVHIHNCIYFVAVLKCCPAQILIGCHRYNASINVD